MNAPLDLRALYAGKRFLVVGGTGFLGKVWLSMLLTHLGEQVDHVWLVVRERRREDGTLKQSSEQRFWAEIASSKVFAPLRKLHPGGAFEAFIRQKITPIAGDVSEPCVVPQVVRDQVRGKVHAVVNAAGIVDFMPPLDYALNANAFGMRNLIDLARDLGDPETGGVLLLHTSTCYVAGDRTGQVHEVNPLDYPFPKANQLEASLWDAENEINECVDLVDNVRHRANDAFRSAAFLDEAQKNLTEKGEPIRGSALQDEIKKVKRKFESDRLVEVGLERARFWGWHNTYTYSKSIGEQVLARSGLTFSIVRPAVIESALSFPVRGWNEGINTSAPIIYLATTTPGRFPMSDEAVLDIIPVDLVAGGMLLALAELIEGSHKQVYQLGSSDTNPCKMTRLIELTGLYKRKMWQKKGGNPITNFAQAHMEPTGFTAEQYYRSGPRFLSGLAKKASGLIKDYAPHAVQPLTQPAADGLATAAKLLGVRAFILDQFVPFMATHNYRFECRNVRAARDRLPEADLWLAPWNPQEMDWREYLMEIHIPGLEENVFPQIEGKLQKSKKPLRAYDSLVDLLEDAAEKHGYVPALMRTEEDGLSRVSYVLLRDRAFAVAARLAAAGVQPGDRVVLSGANHPDWPIAFFGIQCAGAVAIPLDPAMEPAPLANVLRTAEARVAIVDEKALEHFGSALSIPFLDLHAVSADMDVSGFTPVRPAGDALASILFTSGTTGDPKGVMLSHGNFAALVGSLATIFPLNEDDRILSVLPLHHTFEFSCGLLLPLSQGSRIVYLDRVDGDRLSYGLREGRITAMVGVPALWQLLERRIRGEAKQRGKLAEMAFNTGLQVNRNFGRSTGLDLGRLLFGTVHDKLGGNIRMLISGGAALPAETQTLFAGLGFPMAEGYGLTEAAPVLSAELPRPGTKPGSVGKPVPGVELKIVDADAKGIGEVWARGPNVMQGYFRNEAATAQVLVDGWLRTGDLGRMDHAGRLVLSGRAKEVVVTASGENVYLDDVENLLGTIPFVKEYGLVGVDDARGGERLALLAVRAENEDGSRPSMEQVRESLKKATAKLSANQQPSVVHIVDADLPRTATRKVQRKGVKKVIETLITATEPKGGAHVGGPAVHAIASIAGVDPSKITNASRLREDLGFDSLMTVELASALEAVGVSGVDAKAVESCETVGDLLEKAHAPVEAVEVEAQEEGDGRLHIPEMLRDPLKDILRTGQYNFYSRLLDTRIHGRAFIPQNRQTIVVSNHCSHLDMGLVKYALGPYGREMKAFAAKDYFFEGNKLWVAYFELLTNLTPLDREAGFRTSFDQACRVIDDGHITLIFPEGTRRPDGTIGEFKPLIGKLALETNVDILPLYLDGTYNVLPKGSALPKGRRVQVRIGPPLSVSELRRVTAGMRPTEQYRTAARLAQRAVEALRDGSVFELERFDPKEVAAIEEVPTKNGVHDAFASLPGRLEVSRIERPLSWYFTLVPDDIRFTVTVSAEGGAVVKEGRPEGGKADCVVKTSPDMMKRIITEAYLPSPPEFMSGAIKTNEIPLLIEFAKVFKLTELPS